MVLACKLLSTMFVQSLNPMTPIDLVQSGNSGKKNQCTNAHNDFLLQCWELLLIVLDMVNSIKIC